MFHAKSITAAQEMGIWAALQWAFATERAELDFEDREFDRPGVSGIYVLMQRGALGCQIDGGGRSRPAHDAEVIANALAALPEVHGGRGMAVQIAAMARSGLRPDWYPEPRPRCMPREWRKTKHGYFAKTEVVGTVKVKFRGRDVVHDVLICPVSYIDTAEEVGAVRRSYMRWWAALDYLRRQLSVDRSLGRVQITAVMPAYLPWVA